MAARGLDIPEVDLVIQCEPPKVQSLLLLLIVNIFEASTISKVAVAAQMLQKELGMTTRIDFYFI